MEEAYATVQPGEPTSHFDEDSVIEGSGGEHGKDGEDRHGPSWDLKGFG